MANTGLTVALGGLIGILSYAPVPAALRNNSRPSKLLRSVRLSLNILAAENAGRFASDISADGVIIVRRYADWQRLGTLHAGSTRNGQHRRQYYDFPLGRPPDFVWTDEEIILDHDSLHGAEFRRIIRRFGAMVRDSKLHYGGYEASAEMNDAWNERCLGPAAHGKLASNCHWYICFRLENGIWKVWRMEYAIH